MHPAKHAPIGPERRSSPKDNPLAGQKLPRRKIPQLPHDDDPFGEMGPDYGDGTHTDSSSDGYATSGPLSQSISVAFAELSFSESPITRVAAPRFPPKEELRRRTPLKWPAPTAENIRKQDHRRVSGNVADRIPLTRVSSEGAKKLSREIREETAGRLKFAEFTSVAYLHCARSIVDSGYKSVDSIRQMQENPRQYLLTDLRKGEKPENPDGIRLIGDLFGLFVIQKDEEQPKYEEITIPRILQYWPPSITNLRGLLLPGQDAFDRFSFDLAKGRCGKPPIILFATAELHKKPWMPDESFHSMALAAWKTMRKNHKRPSKLELGFQAWVAYNIRFVMDGDFASAWETFGCISMQLIHMGAVLHLAITENATIAMTYDAKVRTYAHEMSEF